MVDTSKMVFVFGSNEGGIHGAGAAKFAREQCGAQYGCGFGHMKQAISVPARQCFAIPTKSVITHPTGRTFVGDTLPLDVIQRYVNAFLTYAYARTDLQFQVTCIGCGLAGLNHSDIAPMFYGASDNCWFDTQWRNYFNDSERKYWGTF